MLEKADQATSNVIRELEHLPELAETIDLINNQEEFVQELGEKPLLYIGKKYLEYLRVIKDLSNLSDSDSEILSKFHERLDSTEHSGNASVNINAVQFLNIVGDEGRNRLLEFVLESADPNSEVFQAALIDLADRMTKAHDMSVKGERLSDGASADADYVIYGFTKGLSKRATIDFVLCHFIERAVTQSLSSFEDESVREMVSHKDYFLDAMTDVLLLKNTQDGSYAEVTDIWSRSREEGGLEWTIDYPVDILKKVIASESS